MVKKLINGAVSSKVVRWLVHQGGAVFGGCRCHGCSGNKEGPYGSASVGSDVVVMIDVEAAGLLSLAVEGISPQIAHFPPWAARLALYSSAGRCR